jgi:hypothetical protein
MNTVLTAPLQASDGSRRWPGLPAGINWVVRAGVLVECDGQGWRNHLNSVRRRRSFYYSQRYFPNRSKWYQVRIPRAPLNIYLVTMTPWWSETCDFILRDGGVAEVCAFLTEWVGACRTLWESETGREVLALSVHCDTKNLHMDLWSTRVGADHRLIPESSSWIGSSGTQNVGVLRQVRAGFRDPQDLKAIAAEHRSVRELERHGRVAINEQLATLTDDLCAKRFGRSRHADGAWTRYSEEWRVRQRMHLVHDREALVALLAAHDLKHGGAK